MNKSNISIKSNVYPKKEIGIDKEFFRHINDKNALEIANRRGYTREFDFTDIQEKIYTEEAKCTYNEDGDFTWGPVIKDGKVQIVCRCINQKCLNFKMCRPDFNKEELVHQNINITSLNRKPQINKIDIIQTNINLQAPLNDKYKGSLNIISNEIKKKEPTYKTNGFKNTPLLDLWKHVNKNGKINNKIVNQEYVIKASYDKKIIVNAGPGTGKTYTLIERLKYLTDKCKLIPAQDMVVLCFSRAAISEIKKRINQAVKSGEVNDDLRFLDIRTFDSFATYLITQLNEDIDLKGKSYDDRISLAVKMIDENNTLFDNVKHFIVDEIQDLVGIRARLVQEILKNLKYGFTLLGDSCQSIYDYQVEDKKNDIDSTKFYRWLNDYFKKDLITVEFDINYRQTDKLDMLSENIRQSILHEESDVKKIEKVLSTIKQIDSIGTCSMIPDSFFDSPKTTCFLTRNNGEALKISQIFRNQGIKHNIQKPANMSYLAPWIGEILWLFTGDSINYDEFKKLYQSFYKESTEDEVRQKWNSIVLISNSQTSRLSIKKIINGIITEKRTDNSLYLTNGYNITVSTIHRAKGREYDRVVLLEDSFKSLINEDYKEGNLLDEAKIYYVAITRPKDEIYITKFNSNIYLKKLKFNENRWVETSRNHSKNYVTYFEIGHEFDTDLESFINPDLLGDENVLNNQSYIINNVKSCDELVLCFNGDDKNPIYKIRHNGKIIGSMTSKFSSELKRGLKEVSGYFYYFPYEIYEVYVDEVISICEKDVPIKAPDVYKKNHIWNGVYLTGFGRIRWKQSD